MHTAAPSPDAAASRPGVSAVVAVARGQLERRRRALAAWSLALAALSVLYTSFWPAFDDNALDAMIENLPSEMVEVFGYNSIGTPAGWLTTTVFGLIGPLLLSAFAIALGAGSVAGDEKEGVLAFELAQPIPRHACAIGRLVAGVAQVGVVIAITVIATMAAARIVGMDIGSRQLLGAGVALFTFVVPWLALSWLIAIASGRRGESIGVATGVAVLSYALHVLEPVTGYSWMGRVSPFHWYVENEPVIDGVDRGMAIAATGGTALAAIVGCWLFARRDLT